MTARATLTVDLDRISANTRRVVTALGGRHVVGVTKVTCGSPQVGRALLAGRAQALGESRLDNAERLRAAGISAPIWLLRSPPPALAADAVRLTDVSLESELETVQALDRAAGVAGARHGVIAMVDLGDLREGMLPADLPAFAEAVERLAHVELAGIGVNLTCYGGVGPTPANLGELAVLAEQTERRLGRRLAFVSAGGKNGQHRSHGGRSDAAGHHQPAHRRDHPPGGRHAHPRADARFCTSTPSAVRGAGDRVQGQTQHADR